MLAWFLFRLPLAWKIYHSEPQKTENCCSSLFSAPLSLFCCCWIFHPAILPMFVTTKFWTPSIYRHQYEYIWDLSNVYFIFFQIFTPWVRLCRGSTVLWSSGFSKLKRLGLHELERLRRIRIAKGSMPGLERLGITACTVLETVPDGIENLKNIEDLVLWYMPQHSSRQ